jgi:hypothetical protein
MEEFHLQGRREGGREGGWEGGRAADYMQVKHAQ